MRGTQLDIVSFKDQRKFQAQECVQHYGKDKKAGYPLDPSDTLILDR